MTVATAPALRIGPLEVEVPVVLAPMAGVTNAAYRSLCRSYGAGLYVSEMVSARALLEVNETTNRRAAFGADETVRSIQLYGPTRMSSPRPCASSWTPRASTTSTSTSAARRRR